MSDNAYLDALERAFQDRVEDIVEGLSRLAGRISRINLVNYEGNEDYGAFATEVLHDLTWDFANLGAERLALLASQIHAEKMKMALVP
jgi:hypothetical protein